MAVYMIAALERLNDQYDEYVRTGRGTLAPYRVTRVTVDDNPLIWEGELPSKRLVILRFEVDEEFEQWWNSKDYQDAAALRRAGARTDFIVTVKGS